MGHLPARFPGTLSGHCLRVPDSVDPTTITAYPDGPLIVRGDFQLLDTDGHEIEPDRRIVALCRCGRSSRKPLCDGSHTANGWQCP